MINILELFSLAGKINLDGVDKANKELDGLDGKSKGLGGKLGGFAKKVGKAGAIAGGAMVAAGTAAFAMTTKVTGAFDDISKGAQRAGVSTDFYQELDYWASQNGMSHENMEKAVGRFNQRLGMAQNGNEKYSEALKGMGVNLEDVRNGTLSTEDAFAQSIKSLSEMENQQDQVNIATEMFGTKLSREMLPALQDGALSLDDAKKKAKELGIVIGEDSLDSAVKFQDTWDSLKRSMGTFGQQVMAQLMPIFQTMMDWILSNMPLIQSIFQTAFDVIGTVFGTVVSWIQSLIAWLGEWRNNNEETMTGIWTTIQEVFTQVIEFLQATWEYIRELWETHGQALLDNVILIFTSIQETSETIFNAVKDIIEQVIGYIVPWVQEKLQVLKDFWEQNSEQIMQAVQNAFSIIQGIIEFVMPIITAIIKGAWDIIKSVFDAAIGIIMGLVKTLSSLLTGDFEGIKSGLTKIWTSLWDGIKGIVSGAWGLLSGAFGALWDNISGWFGDLKTAAFDWGSNMIDGFVDGMKSMGQAVANAAKDVVKKAGDFLKFWSPAKKGEGRYIRHWGRNMIDGFLDGVRDEEENAGLAMENVIKRMNPGSLDLNATANIGGRGVAQARSTQSGSSQSASNTNGNRPMVQFNNTFTTKPLTASEVNRKEKQMAQRWALEGGL